MLRIHLRYLTLKLRALCWVLRQLRARESRGMRVKPRLTMFGVPSQGEISDKVARLSEAGCAFETKLRELEHQFEVRLRSYARNISRRCRRSTPPRRMEANMLTTRDLIRIRYIKESQAWEETKPERISNSRPILAAAAAGTC